VLSKGNNFPLRKCFLAHFKNDTIRWHGTKTAYQISLQSLVTATLHLNHHIGRCAKQLFYFSCCVFSWSQFLSEGKEKTFSIQLL